MTKFFITHSWKDIEFARRLHKDLIACGIEGWMDDSVVRGGQRLAEEINRGLEWCDVYIPIMSPAALESPWCWEEINAAIALTNQRGRDKRLTIIPVIAETCEIPALLSARLYFDFVGRYDDALKELLNKGLGVPTQVILSRSLHPAPVAKPSAPPPAEPKPRAKTTPPPSKHAVAPEPTPPRPPDRISAEELDNLYLEALEG